MRLVDLFRMPAQVTEDGREVHDGMDRYLYHPVGPVVISLLIWAACGAWLFTEPGLWGLLLTLVIGGAWNHLGCLIRRVNQANRERSERLARGRK